jgi:hypothetical protein
LKKGADLPPKRRGEPNEKAKIKIPVSLLYTGIVSILNFII